ncbi:MAG TPA: alkaline phosphatase PhoX, partial [Pyrinomonadaceae bacterium]|nr:alkaline phosphatase PhoX [Pyrinomonadaceae bacterium]
MIDRRKFIISGAAAGGTALIFNGLLRRAEALTGSRGLAAYRAAGFGALAPRAAKNTGAIHLALPEGFEYHVIGGVGSAMKDGRPTPRSHDGMAAFPDGKKTRLVRNHEINARVPKAGVCLGAKNSYDESAGGGTTTLVVDSATRLLLRDFVSLSGTLNNCAGGATPWGSWISCEETTLGQTKYKTKDGREVGGFLQPHGYCFEVRSAAEGNPPPVPLRAMGRFIHEAVAVDPKTGVVYLTEDNSPAGFYRFLPKRARRLAAGGTLQMLTVKGEPEYDTRTKQKPGAVFAATWVTIDNPDPEEADTDESAVCRQGLKKGAAIFARLEGCFPWRSGKIYFASTNGGDKKGGQIWLYEPEGRDTGQLRLVFESPDRAVLDMPDNICLGPRSDLLYLCEDSDYGAAGGGTPENYVRILTPSGRIADFARNVTPGFAASEFAGATFTPDGKTLFVNLQGAGVTLAIWG